MVDTPGMRELQLWDSEEGFEATFADIATLAQQCRFHDCRHETEAGCAVREALQDGTLDARRYANYKKTERSWPISPVKRGSAPAVRIRVQARPHGRATETARGRTSSFCTMTNNGCYGRSGVDLTSAFFRVYS